MKKIDAPILLLILTAILLSVALAWPPSPAQAQVSIKDNDYAACVMTTAQGADALYIADLRAGLLGIFIFDPASRTLAPRVVRPLSDAFGIIPE